MKIDLTPLDEIPIIVKKLEIIDKKLDLSVEKRWLNTRELADYTGYKFETIKSKIKNHEFVIGVHYFKRDAKLLFDKFEIDKWVMGIISDNLKSADNSSEIVNKIISSL